MHSGTQTGSCCKTSNRVETSRRNNACNYVINWACLAGSAALISIVQSSFNTSDRIRNESACYTEFKRSSYAFGILLSKKKINAFEPTARTKEEYSSLLDEYSRKQQ